MKHIEILGKRYWRKQPAGRISPIFFPNIYDPVEATYANATVANAKDKPEDLKDKIMQSRKLNE